MKGDFRIGSWLIQPQINSVSNPSRTYRVRPAVMDVLVYMASHSDEVLSKDRIIEAVWSDTFVTDNALTHAISELRNVFEDDPHEARIIETIPGRGYRLIPSVEFIGDGLPGDPTPRQPTRGLSKRLSVPFLVMTVVASCLVTLALLWRADSSSTPIRPSPLTSYKGREVHPAISPDGTWVAFSWRENEDDNFDIWVQPTADLTPARLTTDPAPDFYPTWSPDGTRIAFLRPISKRKFAVVCTSILGGKEMQVTETNVGGKLEMGSTGGGISWSPVEDVLAIVDRLSPEEPDSIFLLSLERMEKQRLTNPPAGALDSLPVFSPNGNTVAFHRLSMAGDEICFQDVRESHSRCLPPEKKLFIRDLDWISNGSEIVFTRSQMAMQDAHLMRVPVGGGEPQRLPFGDGAVEVSIARRGGRLVYALVRADQDIWRVSGPRAAQQSAPTRFAVSSTRSEYLPVYSPDGSQVAFGSDQSGGIEIWRSDADGRDLRALTNLGATFLGGWSPCGKQVAFAGESEGGWDILVADVAGGLPRNATPDKYADSLASWSPDGRWIYYSSERAGIQQIFKVPVEGGTPEQITRNGGASPRATKNGLILFSRAGAIWGLSESGGEETLILDEDIPYFHWCVWNESIVYIADGSVKEFDLTTREITWHRDLEGNPGLGLTVSPDGRWILYAVVASLSSDLRLVEGFD